MTTEIVLALAASVFTASASVAQRIAAAPAPGELRFRWRLVAYLLHRPAWLLGILCMIGGFIFQLAALHSGDLSLVEPVIASELLFVFGYLALRQRGMVRARDWAAAAGMALALAGFLYLAQPTGDSVAQATAWTWLLAGTAVAGAAALMAALSQVPGRRGRSPSPARRAALLSVSAGIMWGFVAAVVKELSAHLTGGPFAVLRNWSPYVLIGAGMVAMYIVANAFHAGPLAASQPGLTIVDPVVAVLLGVTVFGEHLRNGVPRLGGEAVCAAVLVACVVLLTRSPLIVRSTETRTGSRPPGVDDQVRPGSARRSPEAVPEPAPGLPPAPSPQLPPHDEVLGGSAGGWHRVVAGQVPEPSARPIPVRRPLFTGLLRGVSLALSKERSTGRRGPGSRRPSVMTEEAG